MSELYDSDGILLHDSKRLSKVGNFIRSLSLDELPTLLNIIKGDMSLVGPRPMVTNTFSKYPEDAQKIINTIRPGLTGIGSIVFRDEEKLLDGREDPVGFYDKNITPHKADLEVWFVKNYSLWLYFKVIFITAWVIFFPSSYLLERVVNGLPKLPENLKN